MICLKCNTEVSDTANFCPNCGSAIPKEKRCPHCNSVVSDDANFCGNCGSKLTTEIITESISIKEIEPVSPVTEHYNSTKSLIDEQYKNMSLNELLKLEKKSHDPIVQSYISLNLTAPLKMQIRKDHSDKETKRFIKEALKKMNSLKWARKAAEQGEPRAITLLAWDTWGFPGSGPNDYMTSFEKAKEMFATAENQLGEEVFLEWFKIIVSKLTDAFAITLLGAMMEDTKPKMAEIAYLRGAELGDSSAQTFLDEGIGNPHLPM